MASIRCRFCGAEMCIGQNESLVRCSDCGGEQSLPKGLDSLRNNLFVRGSHFRMTHAYQKALRVFDRLIADFPDDAETHFERALCRYGVTFDIPNKPKLNRTLQKPFLEDDDIRFCLAQKDDARLDYYKNLSQRIGQAQEQIQQLCAKLPPYDIYLCAGDEQRCQRIAKDIYNQLQQNEYKVYFSQASEDVENMPKEIYSYAALQSSKVMLVVGTDKAQFENVWVTNAFERFIELQLIDSSKVLISCYRDMDSFDLPEELALFEALDIGRIDFLSNLSSALVKAMAKGSRIADAEGAAGGASSNALLARAFMFLEDGDFQNADRYLERVLDLDVKNSHAYVGKLMVQLGISSEEELAMQHEPLNEEKNYIRALRFADEEYRKTLEQYNKQIEDRLLQKAKDDVFRQAVDEMESADTYEAFLAIEELFLSLSDYEGAHQRARECHVKAAQAKIKETEQRIKAEHEREQLLKHKEEIARLNRSDEALLEPLYQTREKMIREYPDKKNAGFLGSKRKAAAKELNKLETQIASLRKPYLKRNQGEIFEGETFKLGKFIQFGRKNYATSPIEWRMLDYYKGKALILSEKILFSCPFDTEGGNDWRQSLICHWLNTEFFEDAFSEEERALFVKDGEEHPVFVLTRPDVEMLFDNDEQRSCTGTAYAKINALATDAVGRGRWWLKDKGDEQGSAKLIGYSGEVDAAGKPHSQLGIGVRPAIWIDAEGLERYLKAHEQKQTATDIPSQVMRAFEKLELEAHSYLLRPTTQQAWQDIINRYEELFVYRSFAFKCAEADFYANGLIEGVKHSAIHVRSSKQVIDGFTRNIEQAKKLALTDEEKEVAAVLELEGMRRLSKLSRK